VEETKPLYEVLKPLTERVNAGLSGMSKIVGGATAQKDINAATLATFLSVKERCEKDVMLPLREMNEISASRVKTIQEMYKSQVSQIEALNTSLKTLKERMSASAEQLETAEANARILAQRSSSLIQACQDLQPSLSHAEVEFIQFVKRLDAKCQVYEDSVEQLAKAAHEITRSLPPGHKMPHVGLSKREIDSCHDLLKGQELMMDRSVETMKKTSDMLNKIESATGLSNGDGVGGTEQSIRQGQ
jgi:DNA repair exonuclease SbcCD ATPase subunit